MRVVSRTLDDKDRGRAAIFRCMPMNWPAVLWRGLSDEARSAARKLGNSDLKLQTLVVAARYIALAVRAERTERSKESDKAKRYR